jgi:hypothetical protein
MLTKNTVVKNIIKFFNTLPESSFIKYEQTLGFKQKNIGIAHCAVGHLFINPASPFCVLNKIDRTSVNLTDISEFLKIIDLEELEELGDVNNFHHNGNIKKACIKYLKTLIE